MCEDRGDNDASREDQDSDVRGTIGRGKATRRWRKDRGRYEGPKRPRMEGGPGVDERGVEQPPRGDREAHGHGEGVVGRGRRLRGQWDGGTELEARDDHAGRRGRTKGTGHARVNLAGCMGALRGTRELGCTREAGKDCVEVREHRGRPGGGTREAREDGGSRGATAKRLGGPGKGSWR